MGIRPVCLPEAGNTYSNYTGLVAGWGTTEEGGSVSNTLQEVLNYRRDKIKERRSILSAKSLGE